MTAAAAEAWRVAWVVQRPSSPASGAATSWPTAVVAAGTVEAAGTCPGPAAVVSTLDGAESAAGGALTQPHTGAHTPVVPQNTVLNSAGVELGAELNRDTEEGPLPFLLPAAAAAGDVAGGALGLQHRALLARVASDAPEAGR